MFKIEMTGLWQWRAAAFAEEGHLQE